MAITEKLGEAVLELRTDQQGYDSGIDKAKTKTDSLTGSMFKATMAYDIFKKGVQLLKEIIIGSTQKFIEHENTLKQLDAVLKSTGSAAGLTAKQVTTMADSLSALTGIENDEIIGAQNLLLTFTKVGKDVFPLATETILDMSVALKSNSEAVTLQVGKMLQSADAMGAARRMGVSFSDEQIKLGKELEATGRMGEYQAMVLKELQFEFGGSARAARDTFGGSLRALGNNFEDLQETGGRYVAEVGRPFVENLIEMSSGLNNFLNSTEGIEQIQSILVPLAGTFSVAFDMAKMLFDILSKFTGNVFTSLKNGFTDVTGKGNETNVIFSVLGGVMKIIATAFAISSKVVDIFIQEIALLINAIKDSTILLKTFGEAMLDPLNGAKWQAVADNGKKVFDNFASFGTKAFADITGIIDITKDAFKNFGNDAIASGKELEKSYQNTANALNISFAKIKNGIAEIPDTTKNAVTASEMNILDWSMTLDGMIAQTGIATNEMAAQWKVMSDKMQEDSKITASKLVDGLKLSMNSAIPILEAVGAALFEQGDSWKDVGKAGVLAIAGIVRALGDELSAMAAADTVKAIAALASVVGAPAAPGYFSAAGIEAAGAAAAYVASGALTAWAGSFAMGGMADPGLALVGEEGPELVRFGQRSQVIPADETAQMLAGNRGDMVHAQFIIDGRVLFDLIEKGTRDGRAKIYGRAIV